ncbi:MAG TPA: response regulator transcription factor [Candidatus Tumulicola sp.]|jgi:two-component system OmpR family response regulator
MKLLVVEDDHKLSALLARGLRQGGHIVDLESDGKSGQLAACSDAYDVIILDIMLPEKSGLSVARDLRGKGNPTPILMVTARDTPEDVVAGLDAGADDYLRKPFAFSELEARLRTLARRAGAPPRTVLRVGNLTFDTAAKHVERDGRTIQLTSRELAYLEYFMKNAGIVVTRAMLESALWNRDSELSSNAIEVYVRRLRSKIEFDGMPRLITTYHGIGYRFGSPPGAK